MKLNVIFCGSGEFAIPTLRALASQHHVIQIFTQPDRPAGRGRKMTPTPVGQFALENDLPLQRTGDINAEQLMSADVMVVIAFGQKIGEHVVNHARLGAINLHGSRLPKYRGAAPIHATILNGETVAGNSVIRLAQKMDAGPILGMSELPIGELETTGELHDRLSQDGATLVPRVIEDLASGRAVEVEQDHSKATLAPKIKREATRIDWSKSAKQIALLIRAMHPWPGCHIRLIDGDRDVARATLVRARVARHELPLNEQLHAQYLPKPGHVAPGLPGKHTESELLVGAGDPVQHYTKDSPDDRAFVNAVEICEIQPENGRIMTLASFRNGHPWHAGMRIESIV